MIDILMHIHKYVPQKSDGNLAQIFLGRDQLTRERAGSAVDAQLQASTPSDQLRGVIPKIEDWHALVCFYQVYYTFGIWWFLAYYTCIHIHIFYLTFFCFRLYGHSCLKKTLFAIREP